MFTYISYFIDLLLKAFLKVFKNDTQLKDIYFWRFDTISLQVEEYFTILRHVCVYYGLGYVLCVGEESTPFIKYTDQMILHRIQSTMMPVLNNTAFAQILAIL